jgi:hypothetical protein
MACLSQTRPGSAERVAEAPKNGLATAQAALESRCTAGSLSELDRASGIAKSYLWNLKNRSGVTAGRDDSVRDRQAARTPGRGN